MIIFGAYFSWISFLSNCATLQNGFGDDADDCTMTSVPGDSMSGPTSIDMLGASTSSDRILRRSSSPNYISFSAATSASTRKAVTVGICAMEKKSLSKPMKEILTRIEEFEYIRTMIFPEPVILNVSSFLDSDHLD